MTRFLVWIVVLLLVTMGASVLSRAQASTRHHHHHYRYHHYHAHHHYRHHHYGHRAGGGQYVSHPSGCPGTQFCGCGVSVWLFGHPVRSLFLATAYYGFPHDPNGNVAVINRHHVVGIIRNNGDGTALVYDPNSGHHATRVHERNIRGATIVRAGYSKLAGR